MADESIASKIKVGSIWRERNSGRCVRILEEFVHNTGPAWTYINEAGISVPDGPDHSDWYWHYCDAAAFTVWHDFEFVRAA